MSRLYFQSSNFNKPSSLSLLLSGPHNLCHKGANVHFSREPLQLVLVPRGLRSCYSTPYTICRTDRDIVPFLTLSFEHEVLFPPQSPPPAQQLFAAIRATGHSQFSLEDRCTSILQSQDLPAAPPSWATLSFFHVILFTWHLHYTC